jgi:hypothetical protein
MLGLIAIVLFVAGIINYKAFHARPRDRRLTTESSGVPSSLVSPPHQPDNIEDARVFVSPNIDVEYLCEMFEGHTSLQASKMASAFIGKWMRLSGNLGEVLSSRPGASAQVTFMTSKLKFTDVYMYFDKEWVERLSVLKHGDAIRVIGEIEEIHRTHVQLHHCELVS